MSRIRTWHTYLGIFVAPSILFFCLTGAIQLFSLHEAHGKYTPAPIVEKMAKLHKDQVFAQQQHGPEATAGETATAAEPPAADEGEDKKPLATMILKVFFLIVALSLMSSTVIGLWMAMMNRRRRARYWMLLAVGAALPVLLAVI